VTLTFARPAPVTQVARERLAEVVGCSLSRCAHGSSDHEEHGNEVITDQVHDLSAGPEARAADGIRGPWRCRISSRASPRGGP
jgi:hypothetical protein